MPLDHDVLPTFALVRFRRGPGAAAEPGVLSDGRVHPLDLAALGAASLNDVFERWDELEDRVRATGRGQDGLALDDVVLTAPVEPRQVLQTGANYRTHVIDLEVGHMAKDDPRPVEEVREAIGRMMDERAAHGQPYFFLGLAQTVVGDDQDLVLPSYSDKQDWELELAAIIGRTALPGLPRGRARPHLGLDDRQRHHHPRPGVPPRHARDRHRLVPRQERARLQPDRAVRRAPLGRARPGGLPAPARPERRDDAGRRHDGPALRRARAALRRLGDPAAAARRPAVHRQPGRQRPGAGASS